MIKNSSAVFRFVFLFSVVLIAADNARADVAASTDTQVRPSVLVKTNATVRGIQVHLGDVAEILGNSAQNDAFVQQLKDVVIGDAPAPRTIGTFTGTGILDSIEAAGISRNSIGYSIPNILTVEREGRVLAPSDVLAEVKKSIVSDTAFDVQVRDVQWSAAQVLPVGETSYSIKTLGDPNSGKLPIQIAAFVDSQPAARFLATAIVDFWKEVPVLNKPLERGMLISPDDVEMVRLNLQSQPNDLVTQSNKLVGFRTKSSLRAGETVRRSQVDVPPVIAKGSRVTMFYRQGVLEATATGVAVEDGFDGGEVQIRNENSKKVIQARVVNAETVEVSR